MSKDTSCHSIQDALNLFSQDVKAFWAPLSQIDTIDSPTPFEFYKNYVAKNIPVIIKGVIDHWPAMDKWQQLEYLEEKMQNKKLKVAVTPQGLGDAVVNTPMGPIFVQSEERLMTFTNFLNALKDKEFDGVPYLSQQNDCLREEFKVLEGDVDSTIDFSVKAFGNLPEAVNIWIGDERSVSTVHKDHYENLYCVVKGEKHFTLLPPGDVAFLYEKEFPSGRYVSGLSTNPNAIVMSKELHPTWSIQLEPERGLTPWIPVDPLCPDLITYPEYAKASPIHCIVKPGETLYLPSMWYHRVAQHGITIAVNYWHDMEFDHKYVYYNLARNVAQLGHPAQN